MKKLFSILLAAAVVFGCAKPELDVPTSEQTDYNTVLTAKMPVSKVTVDNDCVKLTWNAGDKISVLTSAGVYKDFVYNGEDGVTSAQFQGNLDQNETVAGYAIYPANAQHSVADGRPQIFLPDTYEWKDGQVMGPMVASVEGDEATFMHAGGLFVFDMKNVPAGTAGFRFTTGKVVTGSFDYADGKVVAGADESDEVLMTFDALSAAADMRFHIPVPTGTYPTFTVSYVRGGNDCVIKSSASTNEVTLASAKLFEEVVISGGTWYVTTSGTDGADGYSWTTATTLSNALAKAVDGDVIRVAAGTYVPDTFISGKVVTKGETDNTVAEEVTTATGEAQKAFIVDKNVTLLGGYPADGGEEADPETNETVLSGNDVTNHVVVVCAPKVTGKAVKMSGFTVSGASSNQTEDTGIWQINGTVLDDYTGAMAVVGTSLSLESMIFTGNNTENASAIYGANSVVDIRNCVFTGNAASSNGTVWFSDGSELTFADSEISKNTAANASGLYLYLSSDKTMKANVSDVKITENTSSDSGAVYLRTETAGQNLETVIDGCIISKNKGKNGAGININEASGILVKNTEITECEATGSGAAVYCISSSLNSSSNKFEACSIKQNTGVAVGAVMNFNNAFCDIKDCEISKNEGQNNGLIYIHNNNKIEFDGCSFTENKVASDKGGSAIYAYVDVDGSSYSISILNSLISGNNSGGKGTVWCRGDKGTGTLDVVNCTFTGNTASNIGSAINLYKNITVNLISNTITGNICSYTKDNSRAGAICLEAAPLTVYSYNNIISGNIRSSDNGVEDVKIKAGDIVYKYSVIAAEYYNDEGVVEAVDPVFNYATMLGALTTDGVCPLLLPDTNPAYTGGMTSEELSALASTNVPATVLTKDQLGNDRTGTVIGAWTPVAGN